MTAQERNIGSRWFEEVWNQKRREAIAELMAPTAVLHDGQIDSTGPEGFYPFFDRIHATFSEIHCEVHDTVAEGNKLCFRWSFRGKHTGSGLGFAPTGKTVSTTGMGFIVVEGGKMAEAWQNWDMLGLVEQIQGQRSSATYVSA